MVPGAPPGRRAARPFNGGLTDNFYEIRCNRLGAAPDFFMKTCTLSLSGPVCVRPSLPGGAIR